MTEASEYYALLGVSRSATPDEIAAAYRRLARAHHPDVSDAPGAADRMVAINRAYRVLSDPARRVAYDAMLHGLPVRAWYITPAAEERRPPAAPRTSSTATRLVGAGFLGVVIAFIAVACVLSAQIPTTTRPDGFVVLPRATATALALVGLPSAQRTTTASQSTPVAAGARVPGALRDHPALRQFPGPVLVPPTSLAPFDAFASDAPNVSSSACDGSMACVPRYTVDYGTPNAGGQISGFGGRGIFDADVSAATACGGSEPVCASTGVSGRPNVQYVRDLQVLSRFPSVARHQDCCPGPFWVITWYDASGDSTYRLQLSGSAAVLGPNAPSSHLADEAAALVTIASGLVALR